MVLEYGTDEATTECNGGKKAIYSATTVEWWVSSTDDAAPTWFAYVSDNLVMMALIGEAAGGNLV